MKNNNKIKEDVVAQVKVDKSYVGNFSTEEKRAFVTWLLTIILLFLILYSANYNFSNANGIWMILFLGDVLIGSIAFLYLIVNVISSLFKRETFIRSSISLGMIVIILLSILFIFYRLPIFTPTTLQSSKSIIDTPSDTSNSAVQSPIVKMSTATVTPKPVRKNLDGGYLFNLVNSYRAKEGLQLMNWWHPLCEYSKSRASEVKSDWSHNSYQKDAANGTIYGKICPECLKTGENLAKDYWTEESIIKAWLSSPGHKANLDDPAWNSGCAMIFDNNFVSFEFGQRK